jgi:autotransporter-associated beta strand protein
MKLRKNLQGAIHLLMIALTVLWPVVQPMRLSAVDNPWTAGSGADFLWNNGANWSGGIPTSTSDVIFPKPIPNPGSLLNPQTITLGAGSTANSLSFFAPYTLTGGSLSLSSGAVRVTIGNSSTIASQLTGVGGLLKTGDGALKLTDSTNSYTGITRINEGTVIVADQGALGTDASAVIVAGNAIRGSGGGNLTIGSANNNLAGLTWTRALALTGGGPTGDGNAFSSVGNNIFTGAIVTGGNPGGLSPTSGVPVVASGATLASTFGTASISGGLTLDPLGQTTILTGNGNWNVNSVIDGSGNLQKSGAGLAVLSGNNTFSGNVIVQGGFLRVSSAANLGTSVGSTAIDISTGTLEVRSDAPAFSAKPVRVNGNGALFVDRAIGGSGLNQTATFGAMTLTANRTFTINSRNGYGVTFNGNMVGGSLGNSNTFTNNANGLVTFSGTFWNQTNSTARTMTINGTGDTLITGAINASGADHVLTKAGAGTLTVNGTGSSYTGATNISAGTLAINDFRAVTNNTAAINIGSTATAGTLTIGTSGTPTAAGLTTSKVINLAGTTGGATINANQSGADPVILNANFTASGTGSKTLTLGGTSTVDNVVNGIIPNNGVGNLTSLLKADGGKWVLAGANSYTGSTSVLGGTLQLNANAPTTSTIIANGSAINLGVLANVQNSGGALVFRGDATGATTEALGQLSSLSGSNRITLNGNGFATNLTFASLGTVVAGTGATFGSSGVGGGTLTITGAANTNGIINPHLYANNGADFASSTVGVVGAASYTSIAGALAAGNTLPYLITGASTSGAITVNGGIKFDGSHTLTVSGTTTIRDGANVGTAGGILVANGATATITGGTGITSGGNTQAATGSTTNGSATITVPSTAGILPGMYLTGTGIPANTTVVSITNATTLVLSQSATATAAGSIAFTNGSDIAIRTDGTGVLNLSTPITGLNGLTKDGPGTLVISGTNTQTLPTMINEGTVRLSGTGKISGNSTATTIRTGATLDLNGVTMAGTAIGAFNGGGSVVNSSATAATLTVGNGNFGGTFSGTISGPINLQKNGTGGQTWTGLNSYTGTTTINSTGVVSVTNLANGGLPSSIGQSGAAAGNLVFGGTSATQAFGGISYTGADSVSTNRLFTFNGGANGGARIQANGANNATLQFTGVGNLAFGSAANTNPQGLVLGGASLGDNLFTPNIVNNPNAGEVTSLYKADAGLWILGGTNSYTGATTIRGGALRADTGTTLPTSSPLVLDGGVIQSSGSFTRSLNAAPAAATGGVNFNATSAGGFAASTNKLTVNIGGSAAPLTWATGGFAGGTLILSSSTSLAEVEIVNPINLNAANRTIQVDINTTTNSDLATLSGVVSGGAGSGLTKTGAGILQLLAQNAFVGDTAINGGTVRAVDIGNSLSTSSNFGTGAGKITIGTGATAGTLAYVGGGESTNRLIELAGSTANAIIESSGTGALVLTNVSNVATGARTLFLRGDLNAANEITSNLVNGGGALTVTKDDNGTWILSGNNTFTGNLNVTAGALGLRSGTTSVGATRLAIGNGGVFALDGDLSISTPTQFNGNTSPSFIGINNITLASVATTTGGNTTVTNSLPTGKFLTINSPTYTGTEAATARTLVFNGGGDTILNASVTDSAGGGLIGFTYNGYGSLTLGGSNGASTYSNATTLTSGTLKLGVANAIPNGTGKGNVTLNPGEGLTAKLDLNGFDQTINGLTASTAGNSVLNNSSSTPVTLTVGSTDQVVSFIGSSTNTGSGALSIAKIGTAAATFSQGPYGHTGATSVTGGTLTFNGPVTATTSLNAGVGANLAVVGGITNPNLITSISVGNNAGLNVQDGVGTNFDLNSLTLGSAGGTITNLFVNAGDGGNTDRFNLLTGGTLNLVAGNQIRFNVVDSGLSANTQYILADATAIGGGFFGGASPLSLSDYLLAAPGGFATIDLTTNSTTNQIILTTGALLTGDWYWTNDNANLRWNEAANWDDLKVGGANRVSTPGAGSNVIFQADGPAAGAIATTLEQNIKINSLTTESSTNPLTSVTINSGVGTNRLEIAPQASSDGITMDSVGTAPTSLVINSDFRAGSDQEWDVQAAAATFTLNSSLQTLAGVDIVKTGAGKATLAAAATSLLDATSSMTVSAGTLEITNVGALGTTVLGNAIPVTVSGTGAFYYNNAASGTVNNPLTLAGGTISAGGNAQTYSGTLNISSDSFFNARDNNSAIIATTTRNVTFSGAISGSGKLTIDGNDTPASGNQVSGQFNSTSTGSTWNGTLSMNRSTAIFGSAAGISGINGSIEFNQFGRVILRNTDGNTFNRSGTLNFAAGAVGELQVDNVSGSLGANWTVVQNGAVNLKAGSIVRLNMQDVASALDITGGVVLNGNASITATGGDADSFVTISGTGISGTGDLAINDEAGVWNVNSSRLAITAASTYVGNTTLTEGTLILGHKDALSTGSLTILGASTVQASANLSGANAVANPVTQQGQLTISGTQNLELSGVYTATGADAGRTLNSSISGPSASLLISGTVNVGAAGNTIARTWFIGGTGDTTISGNMVENNAFANNVTINNSGTTILSGSNSYSGATTVNSATAVVRLSGSNSSAGATTLTSGTIQLNSSSNGGLASGLLTLTSGTLTPLTADRTISNDVSLAAVTVTGTQSLTVNGSFTNDGGDRTLTNNLASPSLLTLAGPVYLSESVGTGRTLTVAGAGNTTMSGAVQNANGVGLAGNLTKTGSGTLTLSGLSGTAANNYSGTTTLDGGTTAIVGTASLAGGLTVGTAGGATVSSLDLSSGSATFAGATVIQTNTATPNTISIGTGRTLRLDGSVAIGTAGVTGGSDTVVNATGLGTLSVGGLGAPTNADFSLGQNTTTQLSNGAVLDMSGLSNFYANLGTGTLRIGDPTNLNGQSQKGSSLILAADSTILASTITQNSPDSGVTQRLRLGSATNTLAAGTINVGSNNGRSSGILDFNSATGTVLIRSLADPVNGRALLNVANNTFSTGANTSGTFDVSGHSADLRFSTVTVAGRSANTGNATGTFSFDLGTLDAENLNVGIKSGGTAIGTTGGTVNIGGGSATFGSVAGPMVLGSNATALGTASGTLNITGGAVSVGGNAGTAIALGNATTAGGTATGVVGLAGGSLTVGGNIVRGATTGTSNATVTLNGGSLNVGGFNIGASGAGAVTFNAQSGTLQNLGELNGGGTLDKTTTGTLTLQGTNTYTGLTQVSDGTLALSGGSAVIDSGAISVLGGATLQLNSSETIGSLNGVGGANLQSNALTVGSGTFSGSITGAGGQLTKTGSGTLTLDGSVGNTYTGLTTVSGGVLALNKSSGVDAIAGDPISVGKTPRDILVNGGTLRWDAGNQVGDSTSLRITSGTVDFNNFSETLFDLKNVGGTVNYGTGSVTITDPEWYAGSTNTVSGATSFGLLDIYGGTNTVNAGGNLTVGSMGNLRFLQNAAFTDGEGDPIAASPSVISLDLNGVGTAGTLTLASNVSFGPATGVGAPGTFDSSVSINSVGGNLGQVDLGGANRTFDIGNSTASVDMSISAGIINGEITKTGSGTLLLSGANTYTGTTTVNNGTLVVNGSISNLAGNVTVGAGATLAGNGTIGGDTTILIGGTHAIGDSITGASIGNQIFSTGADLSYVTGSTIEWELGTNSTSSTFDTVTLNGGALSFGDVNTNLVFGNGVDWSQLFWQSNQQWTVYSGAGTGLISFLTSPLYATSVVGGSGGPAPLPGAFSWTPSVSGTSVILNYNFTPVPEPASMGGMLVLLGSWVLRRRSRRPGDERNEQPAVRSRHARRRSKRRSIKAYARRRSRV